MSVQPQQRENIKPISPPNVSEMTTIREWAQHLRKLADMHETFRRGLMPKNPAAHQRLIGRIEAFQFIADLFQLQIQADDTAILDVVGPSLSDLVEPHVKSFVEINNTNVTLAVQRGVDLTTLDQILGQKHAEPVEHKVDGAST